MFYQTTLQSVGDNCAVDVFGRSLKFIGYLPVQPGDIVWTDGNVIFGNVPPRSLPLDASENGIPVLGEDELEDELRGYFSSYAKYRKYSVKGEDWIVNSKSKYAHDNGKDNIIDAEFSDDGKLLTVEKIQQNFYARDTDYIYSRFSNRERAITYLNPHPESDPGLCFSFEYDSFVVYGPSLGMYLRTIRFNVLTFNSSEYARLDNIIYKDVEIKIKKDGKEIDTFTLSSLLLKLEEDVSKNVNFIEVDGETPRDRIRTRAKLINFKINSDATWEALIECRIIALREFMFYADVGDTRKTYESSSAHLFCVFKVDSNGEYTRLYNNSFVYPLYLNKVVARSKSEYFQGDLEDVYDLGNSNDYPCIINVALDDIMAQYYVGNKLYSRYSYQTIHIYDSRVLPNAPQYSDWVWVVDGKPAEKFTPGGNAIEKYTYTFADYFTFPVQDGFYAKLKKFGIDEEWQLAGIFDKDNKQILGAIVEKRTDAYKWNMSLAPLKDGGYLFGVRDNSEDNIYGFLLKFDKDGNYEQVGYGLKNFRLRELRNIAKARK